MLPNLVLVGFMGSGKTSVGRRLAGLTGHRLVDTDELVTREAGVSIPEIFEVEGEAGFRVRETAALSSLEGVCGLVVSTGGGMVIEPGNRARLRALGVVGWLDAEPDVLFERASRSGKRPLLWAEDPRSRFGELLGARRSCYEEVSDFRVDSTGLTHDEAATLVLERAVRHVRAARHGGQPGLLRSVTP